MPTLQKVIDACCASCPTLDRASLSRLEFWCASRRHHPRENVDDTRCMLAERGRLAATRVSPRNALGSRTKAPH